MSDWMIVVNPLDRTIELFNLNALPEASERDAPVTDGSLKIQPSELPHAISTPAVGGSAHRFVVGLLSTTCLCGSFECDGRRRTTTELAYLAEQYIPWSAEDCYFAFHRNESSCWFVATPLEGLREVLKSIQSLDGEILVMTPLPFLALVDLEHSGELSNSITSARLISHQYGEDEIHWRRQKRRREVVQWSFLPPSNREDSSTAPVESDPAFRSWDLLRCCQGAKILSQSNQRPAVDFLEDPRLSEFQSLRGEKNLAFGLLVLTVCMLMISAVTIWKTLKFGRDWQHVAAESEKLLEEVLPRIPAERRSSMLVKSHRRQLQAGYDAALKLPVVPDPEAPLVRLLEVLTRHPGVKINELRTVGSAVELIAFANKESDEVVQFKDDLTTSGFEELKLTADPQDPSQVRVEGRLRAEK